MDSRGAGPPSDPRLHYMCPPFVVGAHKSCRVFTKAPAAPEEGMSALALASVSALPGGLHLSPTGP